MYIVHTYSSAYNERNFHDRYGIVIHRMLVLKKEKDNNFLQNCCFLYEETAWAVGVGSGFPLEA